MSISEEFELALDTDLLRRPGAQLRGIAAVIDTNTVLDLIYWTDAKAAYLRDALEKGLVTAVRDRASVSELAEVISRDRFLGDTPEALARTARWCDMTVPADEAAVRETWETLGVKCRDPLDQKFLVLAVAAKAGLLVTKDKLVLKAGRKLKRFGILCVKPEEVEAAAAALQNAERN